MKSFVAYLSAFVLAAEATENSTPGCNADNVLRALRNTKLGSGPSSFCSGYIQYTAPRTIVSSTVTRSSLSTTQTTLPNPVVTVTATLTVTNTLTTTSVSTSPNPTETSTSTSSFVTIVTVAPRAAAPPGLPTELVTVPASRLSSACSCLLSGGPTTTVVSTITAVSSQTSTSIIGPVGTNSVTSTSLTTTDVFVTSISTAPPTSTVTVTTTVTQSSTSTTSSVPQPTTGPCSGLSNPYTAPDGHTYQLACNSFYPIRGGGLVGTGNYPLYSDCVNSCGNVPACAGVDYDPGSGLCDLFNNNHNGAVAGFQSALKLT